MIWIREDLRALFEGLDLDGFLALGESVAKRSPDGTRTTSRFERGGRAFYVKAHTGVGWGELAKNWLQGKHAVVDAATEVRALERCAERGVPAPRLAAHGTDGAAAAARRSFVVTEAIEPAERLTERLEREAARPDAGARRRAWARALGLLVGELHAAGLAHRDLYLTHVLVRGPDAAEPELALIDLHRALPADERLRVKDLAALLASARRAGATRADALRFLRAYGVPGDERALARRVARRAARVKA